MRINKSLQENRSRIQLILFDVDGVLIDTGRSFPEAIASALVHYGRLMGLENWQRPLPDTIAAFKAIPGFNNDWDLEEGILVFYLQHEALAAPLLLEMFLEECTARGGGMAGVKAWLQVLPEAERIAIKNRFQADLIRRLAMEYYAGERHCEALYGFTPEFVHSAGTLELEKPLVNCEKLRKLSEKYALGISSGRSQTELELIGEKIGLDLLPPENIVVDDGVQPVKPSPEPVYRMAVRAGTQYLVFVGDSFDDYQMALRFNREYPDKFCEFVQVSTNQKPFAESISVVANVNHLLDYLLRS